MAISIVPGSVSLTIGTKPEVKKPFKSSSIMEFNSEKAIEATGKCQLTGLSSDNAAGWTLGFIQVQHVETNWAYYRGAINADGAAFVHRSSKEARGAEICRDAKSKGDIWFQNKAGKDLAVAATGTFPISLEAVFYDGPFETYDLYRKNTKTTKFNYLREVQLEFHFCTVLSLKSPGGTYQHLKHFLWNMHWQARFDVANPETSSPTFTVVPVSGKSANCANVSPIADGGPVDHKRLEALLSSSAPNCNDLAKKTSDSPSIRESATWDVVRG